MSIITILLPSADLCGMYKKWETHRKVVIIVMEEMWSQVGIGSSLNLILGVSTQVCESQHDPHQGNVV